MNEKSSKGSEKEDTKYCINFAICDIITGQLVGKVSSPTGKTG